MPYSNDETQIKAGLINYIGAMLKASKFSEKTAKQSMVSVLTEETLKLSQDENGVLDIQLLKPMLKGVIFLFNQRIHELQKLPKSAPVSDKIKSYEDIIRLLNDTVSVI